MIALPATLAHDLPQHNSRGSNLNAVTWVVFSIRMSKALVAHFSASHIFLTRF